VARGNNPNPIPAATDHNDEEDILSKNKNVLVSFLLDRSASMGAYRDQTIDAFNEYLNGIRGDGNIFFSLTTFDSTSVDLVFDAIPVGEVRELTPETFQPRGMTPLYDAIGETVSYAASVVAKGGFGKKKTQRVLFVILTDGYENASHVYSRADAFNLLKTKEALGWTTVYLGANQDAYGVGVGLAVPTGNIANFNIQAMAVAMPGLAGATRHYARTGGGQTSSLYDDAGVDITGWSGDGEEE